MAPWPLAPGPDAVVGADKVLAGEHGIVPVGTSSNQLPVDPCRSPVSAAVVRAERVTERS
jgi:hypothetical protein